MYHHTPDLEYVKRFGRWSPASFQYYFWDGHEEQKGLSTAMVKDDFRLIKTTAEEEESRGRVSGLGPPPTGSAAGAEQA